MTPNEMDSLLGTTINRRMNAKRHEEDREWCYWAGIGLDDEGGVERETRTTW